MVQLSSNTHDFSADFEDGPGVADFLAIYEQLDKYARSADSIEDGPIVADFLAVYERLDKDGRQEVLDLARRLAGELHPRWPRSSSAPE